jgi:hypothetical protein
MSEFTEHIVKIFLTISQPSTLTHLVFLLTHHRLLNTLTHALQSSGVDLSQANISVQINLGKRAVKRPTTAGQSSSFQVRHSYRTRLPYLL